MHTGIVTLRIRGEPTPVDAAASTVHRVAKQNTSMPTSGNQLGNPRHCQRDSFAMRMCSGMPAGTSTAQREDAGQLIKTTDLDPSKNYVFGFHPHGVLIAGGFTNFCTEATGFSDLFPGITPYLLMLPLWFRAPFFRDYIMTGGLIPSNKESAAYVLSQKKGGTAVVIAVGGAAESLDARPGACSLLLKNKKGFIKLAIEHGASLVPIFSFGENELYDQVENPKGSLLRTVQEKLQKLMGVALPLFHARGVFQYSFGLIPYRRPINTIVGKPIPVVENPNPSVEEVDRMHKLYMQKLSELFEEHKTLYNVPADRHLTFI